MNGRSPRYPTRALHAQLYFAQRKTHKHRPTRIGRIRDENILFRATVELINQPRINRTESKDSFLVRSFDLGLVL